MENLAVIELNESMVKLSIFKVSSGRTLLIEEKSQPFKLGEEILQEELLRPKTKNEILEVLKIYRKMIETYKVNQILAYASNILTQARNYRGFIDEIYNNTGVSFTILQNEEVIKYNYNAVVNSIDNSKGYLINVNPYNINFIKYNRRTILSSFTISVGSLNLRFDENGNPRSFDEMVDYVKSQIRLLCIGLDVEPESAFVGNGKAFLAFGKIAKKIARYPLDLDNNYCVSSKIMNQTVDFVKGIDTEKISKIKGIDMDATEVLSSLAIVKAFYDELEINELAVSTASLRDGMVHATVSVPAQEKFNDLLANSIDNYYEFYKDEYSNNFNVYQMSIILFKQLKVMHKLPRYYIKPLRIAGYLYNTGTRINYNQYEKYGFDTILYSGITGVSHRELLIGAFVCVCQNMDNFSLNDWIKYKDILTDEDLDAVRKLGIIVKLASALNASKKVVITDVVCDILGDSIIMKTVVNGDPTFEIMEGMKVAPDYKKVFKKSLQII